MPALAFSNNDIAIIAWTYDRHIDGCLGFAVIQIDDAGNETPLRGLASFEGQAKDSNRTTEQAPIQKFWWKDLSAKRGASYTYRIIPMGGTPGGVLKPLAGIAPLVSNKITLTPDRPPFKAYFNRGIVATQALTHALNDKPSLDALTPHILNPSDPIRIHLMGQLFEGVTALLDRADDDGGTIHGALYELNDPDGLEKRLQANPASRTIILGNEQVAKTKTTPASEDADAENRANLKKAGVTVIDRIIRKGDIPHNKFLVLSEKGKPSAVLSGSTNWTSTGLCTQTNNALLIESADVAQRYIDYWNTIKADVDSAAGDQKKLQSPAMRKWNHDNNASSIAAPIPLGVGVTIEPMFSPNTDHVLASPPRETPNDMQRVFDLIAGAKQAVLFLAFDPGNNSILNAAGKALAANPDLFVRGALTNAQRASQFSESLHQGGEADQSDTPDPEIKVVGEPGKPKIKGAKSAPIDYRAIPAGNVTAGDAFGGWEAEMQKYGFAIIHNKIVVIDPFSPDCTVVTGSHNLGFRASHNNDENMVIVRGHRGLAEAYACHVLDIYDHYAWRYWLKTNPGKFGKPLVGDDSWQERYIVGSNAKSPELRFWLSAAKGGDVSSSGTLPPRKPAGGGRPEGGGSAKAPLKTPKKSKKSSPADKRTAKKTATKNSASKTKAGKKAAKKTAKTARNTTSRKSAKTTTRKSVKPRRKR